MYDFFFLRSFNCQQHNIESTISNTSLQYAQNIDIKIPTNVNFEVCIGKKSIHKELKKNLKNNKLWLVNWKKSQHAQLSSSSQPVDSWWFLQRFVAASYPLVVYFILCQYCLRFKTWLWDKGISNTCLYQTNFNMYSAKHSPLAPRGTTWQQLWFHCTLFCPRQIQLRYLLQHKRTVNSRVAINWNLLGQSSVQSNPGLHWCCFTSLSNWPGKTRSVIGPEKLAL